MPIIILGTIYAGIMTPTECVATAVVYSRVVGLFIYRELKWFDLPKILFTSAAMVMFIAASVR